MELETGYFALERSSFKWYKPLSYISAGIRLVTKTNINHVYIFVKNWDKVFVNEAVETGVKSVPFKDRLKDNYIEVYKYKGVINEKGFATTANDFLGHTGYDFSSLFLFQLWFQITGKWLGRTEDKATNRMNCSEYIAYLYKLENWWLYSPDMLQDSEEFELVFKGIDRDYYAF